MKVAAAQISCSLGDPKANLLKVRDFSRRGSDAGVELIVFPEMTDTGYSMSVIQAHANSWTSGFIPGLQEIAAKTRGVYVEIQRAWSDAEKDYLAVVRGHVDATRGEIDLPLGTDPADRRRRVVRPDGARSMTRFERLGYSEAHGVSLLRCRLVTGRRHQIRVHLAARGWPIVGDVVYGTPDSFPRHALHAWRAVMRHPTSGQPLGLEAPLPVDLVAFLAAAGLSLTCRLHL